MKYLKGCDAFEINADTTDVKNISSLAQECTSDPHGHTRTHMHINHTRTLQVNDGARDRREKDGHSVASGRFYEGE